MAPLVFDIDEGGHHDHNQEDDDCENNNLRQMDYFLDKWIIF